LSPDDLEAVVEEGHVQIIAVVHAHEMLAVLDVNVSFTSPSGDVRPGSRGTAVATPRWKTGPRPSRNMAVRTERTRLERMENLRGDLTVRTGRQGGLRPGMQDITTRRETLIWIQTPSVQAKG